jgi:CheY-like chemotaxis protein
MTNGKVLVIEDNKLNMKLVRDLLKIGKYQVFEAGDAETGIELAQVHKPDLILMDIQLPGINGLDATKILKEKTKFSSIPIIALTGCAMRGDKKKALDAGCVGYITKPIDTRAFLEKIAQFLNGNPKSTE